MKWVLLCLYLTGALALAQELCVEPGSREWNDLFNPPYLEPTSIPRDSPVRKRLFDLLRPKFERDLAKSQTRFQGDLKAFRNWAVFIGTTLDAKGSEIRFPPVNNTETAALWLHTREGWCLVDHMSGFGDPAYWVWAEQYGVPRKLLGLE